MKLFRIILLFVAVSGLLGLLSMAVAVDDKPAYRPAAVTLQHYRSWNLRMADSAVGLLHTGDVVLRMGMGAQSQLLAQMNRGRKDYSHCGIVLLEKGYPFVYHCIGGEDNPDARLRRDSAASFFAPDQQMAIGIVRYNADTLAERNIIRAFYRRRPRFDMQFDMSTDDKLYCTEFVYKVLVQTTGDEGCIPTDTVMGHRFVGTANLCTNNNAVMVWQVKFK